MMRELSEVEIQSNGHKVLSKRHYKDKAFTERSETTTMWHKMITERWKTSTNTSKEEQNFFNWGSNKRRMAVMYMPKG